MFLIALCSSVNLIKTASKTPIVSRQRDAQLFQSSARSPVWTSKKQLTRSQLIQPPSQFSFRLCAWPFSRSPTFVHAFRLSSGDSRFHAQRRRNCWMIRPRVGRPGGCLKSSKAIVLRVLLGTCQRPLLQSCRMNLFISDDHIQYLLS